MEVYILTSGDGESKSPALGLYGPRFRVSRTSTGTFSAEFKKVFAILALLLLYGLDALLRRTRSLDHHRYSCPL